MNPLLLVDSYKIHHKPMYPDGMNKLYTNGTCRKSRLQGVNHSIVFGVQWFCKEYLIHRFNKYFFEKPIAEIIEQYKEFNNVNADHIEVLHKLGYLPIELKCLPEGTICPIGVPMLTITNTHPDFGWLTNYLETLISCCIWQPMTSATIAYEYKKLLSKYALETTGSSEFVQWQGHDFSMRGMGSPESAISSGMGHLLSFTGTDTVPAIYAHKKYYNAEGLIGASVPATEHSVMCMGEKESELDTFKRLLNLYPTGILSIVSDTWDLWKVCTEYLPALKEQIVNRDGKLVIRPDSGNPVDIICGEQIFIPHEEETEEDALATKERLNSPQCKGVIQLLWETFGGKINDKGYKELDSHIGAIYGDSITLERAKQICERLKAKGFASTNIVFGIGSYTYQYNTRDTLGFAMKATYGEVNGIGREIFKDPITDDGTKRSKKGLLKVTYDDNMNIVCADQQTWEQAETGLLETIFIDGSLVKETTLQEIRDRLK